MTLFRGARQIVTLRGPIPRRGPLQNEVRVIQDGSMLVDGPRIVELGSSRRLENRRLPVPADEVDVRGKVIVPAFVDASVRFGALCAGYAGESDEGVRPRQREQARITLRHHSTQALSRSLTPWLYRWYAQGTVGLETRTVGDMDLGRESRILRAVSGLQAQFPCFRATLALGLPAERRLRLDSAALGRYLTQEFLPAIRKRGLAQTCLFDLDTIPLTAEHRRHTVHVARQMGFSIRVEGDRSMHDAAAQFASRFEATSVYGLNAARPEDVRTLAQSRMAAVLAPGDSLDRDLAEQPPARAILDAGGIVALASGFAPPFSPVIGMPAAIALACLRWNLSPAEALGAATVNAAHCLGLPWSGLDAGAEANFVVLDLNDYRELGLCLGFNPCQHVYLRGALVYPARRPRHPPHREFPVAGGPHPWTD